MQQLLTLSPLTATSANTMSNLSSVVSKVLLITSLKDVALSSKVTIKGTFCDLAGDDYI